MYVEYIYIHIIIKGRLEFYLNRLTLLSSSISIKDIERKSL